VRNVKPTSIAEGADEAGAVHATTQLLVSDAQVMQEFGAHSLTFARDSQEEVLATNVRTPQGGCLATSELEYLFGTRNKSPWPGLRGSRPFSDYAIDRGMQVRRVCAYGDQQTCRKTMLSRQQAKQDVFSADVVITASLRFLRGQRHRVWCVDEEATTEIVG